MPRLIAASERAALLDRGFAVMGADRIAFNTMEERYNSRLAADAQPQLQTVANSGVPWTLANYVDPEVTRVIFAPMRAAEIFGEQKKGDWTTLTTQFPIVEDTGVVTSYGDFNNNGNTGANINWLSRQAYYYQTVSQWGERELEMYALSQLNYKAEVDLAAALVMNKFQNRTYFFGVSGLQLYGALNDPSLIAPITPLTKAAGGVTWTAGTAQEIYADILALYAQLLLQMGNNITQAENLTLAMSPAASINLNKVSQYNVTAFETIERAFPNLKLEVAPEYATTGGQLLQLIITSFEGQQTAYGAFTEKMRMHPVIPDLTAFKQKKSGGTWGMIIRRPICIAQMLGV